MYGWDSYFIIRGLLEDGRRELARGMIENFFYEIEHYGAVLNANRTYYLTRSQPPFLSSMIMAQYISRQAAWAPGPALAGACLSTTQSGIMSCGPMPPSSPVKPGCRDTSMSARGQSRRSPTIPNTMSRSPTG